MESDEADPIELVQIQTSACPGNWESVAQAGVLQQNQSLGTESDIIRQTGITVSPVREQFPPALILG